MPQIETPGAASSTSGSTTGLGSGLLQRALRRADPMMQFDWEVSMQVGDLSIASEYVEEVSVPGMQITSEGVFRAGTRMYTATTVDVGTVTLKMYEDVHQTGTKFLQSWKNKMIDPNGDRRLPSEYWGTIIVLPLAGGTSLISRIICKNVFPTVFPTFVFGSESARVSLDVEFACNTVQFEFLR